MLCDTAQLQHRSAFSLVEREAWVEFEKRKRALLDDVDAGRLEQDAYEWEIRKLCDGMGI